MTQTESTTTTQGQSIGNGDPNPAGLPDGWIEVNGYRWNLAALDAAIAEIEAHPERHVQQHWATRTPCGTAMCLAGMIVHQAGGVFDFLNQDETTSWCRMPDKPDPTFISEEAKTILTGVEFGDFGDPYLRAPDGTLARADRCLDSTVNELFDADNKIEDIKRMRDVIATRGYGDSEW